MKKQIISLSLFFLIILISYSSSKEYLLIGKIESIRKSNIITLIFEEKPNDNKYLIIDEDAEVGDITILSINTFLKNNKTLYRAIAEYKINTNKNLVKTGSAIALAREEKEKEDSAFYEEKKKDSFKYKSVIITFPDHREMVLIPGGNFFFGADDGDLDERPRHLINLDDFYIDKYEVSNYEYNMFVIKTKTKPPASWTGGHYNAGEDDFPVIVSYNEAEKYAEWAGKSLPSEEEWEKSAQGKVEIKKKDPGTEERKSALYPWGNKFDASFANSSEFWNSGIKKKYKQGLLPIKFFKGYNESMYGIVNMAGNAAEWTNSWYGAYKGSKYTNRMFGRQVKVIRGGSWINSKQKLRITNREFGGLPNLEEDNIAGFRCIKYPTVVDIVK